MNQDFAKLVGEADRHPFSGWDFSWLAGRYVETKPSWDYLAVVRERKGVWSMLDIGTGGGERFSTLCPFPAATYATEGYPPNVKVATARLSPLGVKVVEAEEGGELPFEDGFFDLIADRHAGYSAKEVARTLKPGGRFVTQQIGSFNNDELREFFGARRPKGRFEDTFEKSVADLKQAGLRVLQTRTESHISSFHDVGAIVYYLKAISWEVPGFSVKTHRAKLKQAHRIIQKKGKFEVTTSREFIEAQRP